MQPATTPTICANVSMDEKSFTKFVTFDAFRHRKSWTSPLIFTAIMLAFAAVCFMVHDKQGAVLLGVVLSVVGLGLPAVWFCSFPGQTKKAAKRMKLAKPRKVYTLTFDPSGVSVRLEGREEAEQHPWQSVYCVYRVDGASYLYTAKATAFLVPDDQLDAPADELWAMLQQHLSADKLKDRRK